MKRCALGLAMISALVIGLKADDADAFRLEVTGNTPEALQLHVQGSPGLHQLQKRSALIQGDWKAEGQMTSVTNPVVKKDSVAAFYRASSAPPNDIGIFTNTLTQLDHGRTIFRYETFGSEDFWGGTLKVHRAITGTNHGGVGPGVSPRTALSVGLKVNVDALPESLKNALAQNQVDLDDVNNTLALLQLDAVIGLKGIFDQNRSLSSVGIQCSLCHSTVDNSFAPGIGHRLDGWPNRDLNVGAIINLSPDLSAVANVLQVPEATVRTVVQSWGPGKFDAELLLDGKAFRPDGKPGATLLPAAYGLAGVNLHTYTGWGSVTHWNGLVANLEMQGKGVFYDPRLNDTNTFPIAARLGSGNVRHDPDLVTDKLAALHLYQLAIPAPKPATGSFDSSAATRGQTLFAGKAKCATCHVPPIYTEPGWNMHTPSEIGIDDFQASRSPDKRYRTTPLGGLFARAKGGFYHDGRFADLNAVVQHYNQYMTLQLSDSEISDLVEFLKSL